MTVYVSDPLLQFFKHDHLPEPAASVARPFATLAEHIAGLPRNPERTVALRKLLEARDSALRVIEFRELT